ncbi:ArsR/SmtB family transcription factor [Levilactobacillus mulengensis]|uniref:ArsR/SmtB family transcription factor n=1 Tax=Levilactobacillus mulengensis TaxID=2486025 RepID=UPI000F767171|nr:metalloregulator ArsR/SmtB family transcription factor [Levilactobacillus mulengensis]
MDDAAYVAALKAMADENRLKIISLLSQGTLCACDILDHFNFTQPTLSHHMRVLADAGIVTSYKEGKWKHYTLSEDFAAAFFQQTTTLLSSDQRCVCELEPATTKEG